MLLRLFVVCAAVTVMGAAAVPPTGSRILRAGAATSNITPPLGISLDGVIAQGARATHIHDELHARCLALDDGRTRIALVIIDNTVVATEILERAKALTQAQTGLPPDRVLLAATHTHSTPRAYAITPHQQDLEYHEFLARRIADGIQRAINNLAPARIGWGAGRKPEYVFNRRWLIKPETRVPNPFGETTDQVMMNPGYAHRGLVEPAGPVDPEVSVLALQHADGRPLAVLASYGVHYIGGTAGAVSSDYFGAFAEALQHRLKAERQDPPFVGLMFNGTSGDVNSADYSKRPTPQRPYARIKEVGDNLAAEVERVYQSIDYRPWVPIEMVESRLELAVRRPSPERIAWAEKIWSGTQVRNNLDRRTIYARETLEVAKFPATVQLKIQAIRIGELGIAAVPCEVFARTGLEIKARSPLSRTFTIGLANGYYGYLPTPRDHALGGYETWLARSSYLEPQASERIRDEVLRLLAATRTAATP